MPPLEASTEALPLEENRGKENWEPRAQRLGASNEGQSRQRHPACENNSILGSYNTQL